MNNTSSRIAHEAATKCMQLAELADSMCFSFHFTDADTKSLRRTMIWSLGCEVNHAPSNECQFRGIRIVLGKVAAHTVYSCARKENENINQFSHVVNYLNANSDRLLWASNRVSNQKIVSNASRM